MAAPWRQPVRHDSSRRLRGPRCLASHCVQTRTKEVFLMVIERMQVEEGFLDGLDLVFTPGLNVLIGPRGSGKTSVLELLRFCFGVEAFTQKAGRAAQEHALSVLGPSGRVSVTVAIKGERVI